MKIWIRPLLILLGLHSVLALTWLFVPSPFIRGLVAGGVIGAGFLLAGLFLMTSRLRKKHGGQLKPPPLPVTQWDYGMTARELDGAEVDFQAFRGRVLILNFWATWCAPCIAEMPSLARLAESTADVDVVLACITREPEKVVTAFALKRELEVPIFRLEGDPPEPFATRAIPATFIVDRRGTIAFRHVGAAAWDDEQVVEFVRGLATVPQIVP